MVIVDDVVVVVVVVVVAAAVVVVVVGCSCFEFICVSSILLLGYLFCGEKFIIICASACFSGGKQFISELICAK